MTPKCPRVLSNFNIYYKKYVLLYGQENFLRQSCLWNNWYKNLELVFRMKINMFIWVLWKGYRLNIPHKHIESFLVEISVVNLLYMRIACHEKQGLWQAIKSKQSVSLWWGGLSYSSSLHPNETTTFYIMFQFFLTCIHNHLSKTHKKIETKMVLFIS